LDWWTFCHALGYGFLALANLYSLGGLRPWWAWLMTIAYAALDEYHQSFVPGRNASAIDVLLLDKLEALMVLSLYHAWRRWTINPQELDCQQ